MFDSEDDLPRDSGEVEVERRVSGDRVDRFVRRPRRARWPWVVAAMALLVAAAGGVGIWMWLAGVEDRAVAVVEGIGGRVRREQDRARGHVVAVSLNMAKVEDRHLAELSPWGWHFAHLQDLDLSGAQISDAGLQHLEGAPLANLKLADTPISDAGLAHVAAIPSLRSLTLSNTQITDDGLGRLAGLEGLNSLYLEGTDITDAGLAHLKSLPALTYLRLNPRGGKISDDAVERLKQELPQLRVSR